MVFRKQDLSAKYVHGYCSILASKLSQWIVLGSVCVCVVSVVQKFCLVSQNVDLKWRTSFPPGFHWPVSVTRPHLDAQEPENVPVECQAEDSTDIGEYWQFLSRQSTTCASILRKFDWKN